MSNLGHLDLGGSLIESFIFTQRLLFRTDFLTVTSKRIVRDPGCGWCYKSRILTRIHTFYQLIIRKHSYMDNWYHL